MIHQFSYPVNFEGEDFTNPFRYVPHPLVRAAAAKVLAKLEGWKDMPEGSTERELERSFAEGKMLGVLVCRKTDEYSTLCYLAAFSGTVRGADGRATSTVDGFVPPIIDLTSPEGYFKLKEAEISDINHRISELSSADVLRDLKDSYQRLLARQKDEICAMQEQMHLSRIRREEIRKNNADADLEAGLIKESQFQKAQLKRLKDKWEEALAEIKEKISAYDSEIVSLKKQRSEKSDELQKWIFKNALVHNACKEVSNIWDIFACSNLVPPGGTGECAAPKLLEYAYANGLQPLAMGEFWYGLSPETAVRTQGHFYPSCTSKCGPLLGYMMQGLKADPIAPAVPHTQTPIIIHEDEAIIVVEKPSGMPSVPGLDGRQSLLEWLIERAEHTSAHPNSNVHSVHRLDMDTSGVMIYAKSEAAALHIRKQFEEHTIRKTYLARLTCCASSRDDDNPDMTQSQLWISQTGVEKHAGSINLPLSPDYDERPRQKVDFKQGKPAHTDYKILQTNADGTTDILMYPLTGRTHQLRVHCAHVLGLARPIAGDLLYGAHTVHHPHTLTPSRLCLHALSITFTHPLTGIPQTYTSDRLSF